MSCKYCERFVQVALCEHCGRADLAMHVHVDDSDAGLNTEHVNDRVPFDDPLPESMIDTSHLDFAKRGPEMPEGHTLPGPEHKFDWAPGMEPYQCEYCDMMVNPPVNNHDPDCPSLILSQVVQRNPKDIAGATRVPLHLLPTAGKIAQALAHLDGAEKYGVANWRDTPIEFMGYLGAIERHIERLKSGTDNDPKSGVHHLGHIMATCAILLDAQEVGTLVDDRPVWDQLNSSNESVMIDQANKFLEEREPNVAVSPTGIGRQPDDH